MESRKIDLQYNNTISISMLENLGNDLFGFSVMLPLPRKVPDVTKEQNNVGAI